MVPRNLRTVTRTQGNNLALKEGRVVPEGFNLEFEEVPVLVHAFRRMVRETAYDVCEMALTTYLCAREHGARFTALPIFLVRDFHHGAILVNRGAGITGPKDLEGRRVGVNRGYTVTTGVWARAILQDAGAARVTLINRTPKRAASLARELSATGSVPIGSAGLDALNDEITGASILVNATSIGWHGDDLPFPEEVLDGLAPSALVIDLTYRSTSLLRAAQARDLHTADGLPMLVHQGARSFTLWTGIDAPLDVMFAVVAAEQARRAQS